MACWMYVLRGRDGRFYYGITDRLQKRIREHNAGRTRGDRGRGPFELVYKERFTNHATARVREKYLKSGAGREWLRSFLGLVTSETDE